MSSVDTRHSVGIPHWSPSRDLHFDEEGKHIIKFPPDFPFLMKLVLFHYDHKLTPNYHDYLELTYIYEGCGTFHIRNKIYSVRTGDLTVVSAGELPEGISFHLGLFIDETCLGTSGPVIDPKQIFRHQRTALLMDIEIPIQIFGNSLSDHIGPVTAHHAHMMLESFGTHIFEEPAKV